jgi:regulator of protease activity HflC (stomatin/prohibitin superfamily)
MGRITVPLIVLLIAALIVLPQTFFTVDETQMAIVTRLGAYKRTHTEPGLYIKTPFVEQVTRFDKRLLHVEVPPSSILTLDKRNLVIDAFARYRITNPLLFFRTLGTELQGGSRVRDLVASELRREVALDLQSEVISETREEVMRRITRASNRSEISWTEATGLPNGLRNETLTVTVTPVLPGGSTAPPVPATEEQIAALEADPEPELLNGARVTYNLRDDFSGRVTEVTREEALALENGLRNERLSILIEEVVRGRPASPAEITALEREESPPELAGFSANYFVPVSTKLGIEIVDVRIKRADFPESIQNSVFERMKAERERRANEQRAAGTQRELEIKADVDRRVQEIIAEAEGEAARIRGEGEREAIRILAASLNQDPEFYDFQRTLQAYRTLLDEDSTIILDADSDLLKFLQDPFGPTPTPVQTTTVVP